MDYKISDNFKRNHFSCKCGKCNEAFKISLTLVGIIEHLRFKFNNRIHINRAYICGEESQFLFGNSKDYHHLGKALDFSIENTDIARCFEEVESMPEITGIGFVPQDNLIHIDIRDKEREIWLEERKEKIPFTPDKRKQYGINSVQQ